MFDDPLCRRLRPHCALKETPLKLLAAIVRLSRNTDGHCWARASYLGQCIGRAVRTVRDLLSKLRSLGLVHTRVTGRGLICTPVWERLGMEAAHGVRERKREERAERPAESAAEDVPNEGLHPADEFDAALGSSATGDDADTAASLAAPERDASEHDAAEPIDQPAAPPSAPAAKALAQVAARFGVDAERDVAEVIATDRRATTEVTSLALDRLLMVEPARVQRSAGAYFRRLLELASSARLAPTPCRPPSSAAAPVANELNTQVARVNALKDELQEEDLSSERHRQLTIALHRETDALIRLHTAQHARDRAKVAPQAASTTTAPPQPARPRAGPLPEWLAKFVSEQAGDAATSG
jgi:hypothetical protein